MRSGLTIKTLIASYVLKSLELRHMNSKEQEYMCCLQDQIVRLNEEDWLISLTQMKSCWYASLWKQGKNADIGGGSGSGTDPVSALAAAYQNTKRQRYQPQLSTPSLRKAKVTLDDL